MSVHDTHISVLRADGITQIYIMPEETFSSWSMGVGADHELRT